jgi:hypothetical protein
MEATPTAPGTGKVTSLIPVIVTARTGGSRRGEEWHEGKREKGKRTHRIMKQTVKTTIQWLQVIRYGTGTGTSSGSTAD